MGQAGRVRLYSAGFEARKVVLGGTLGEVRLKGTHRVCWVCVCGVRVSVGLYSSDYIHAPRASGRPRYILRKHLTHTHMSAILSAFGGTHGGTIWGVGGGGARCGVMGRKRKITGEWGE